VDTIQGGIPVIRPKEALLDGAKILDLVLLPEGFRFQFREAGKGSGGNFAWGEFVRDDRRLELHFRQSLGLVRYHIGNQSASHESYMRELGVRSQCRYPGFGEEPSAAFHDLAHDLRLADDFLSGSAAVLRTAAAKEGSENAEQSKRDMAIYAGDVRQRQHLRERFREGSYGQVVALAETLKYPEQMPESERRMVDIARRRTLSGNLRTTGMPWIVFTLVAVIHCVLTFVFTLWSIGWQMTLLDSGGTVAPLGLKIVSAVDLLLALPVLLPLARLALHLGFPDPVNEPIYWPLPVVNSLIVAYLVAASIRWNAVRRRTG
jgi:hypothetical protein